MTMQMPPSLPPVDFCAALTRLKQGEAVTRLGWNGHDMFLYYVPGSTFRVEPGRPLAAFWPVGSSHVYHPHIDLWTGHVSIPWVASQADLLATDWLVLEAATLRSRIISERLERGL